jgi:hypothetical protein
MFYPSKQKRPSCGPRVIHHVVCQHQVEVEVWPSVAEVYFKDERFVHPVNTQVQFEASVYNAPTNRVTWQVTDLNGAPGPGNIDAAGLYTAPLKGAIQNGFTVLVVATSVDDPFRKAYAKIALIGHGPEPKPVPRLEIYPKDAYLYYPDGHHNEHIDDTNTKRLFEARIRDTALTEVEWLVDATPGSPGGVSPRDGVAGKYDDRYLHEVTGAGMFTKVEVIARLRQNTSVRDTAMVFVHNYDWPGIVPI